MEPSEIKTLIEAGAPGEDAEPFEAFAHGSLVMAFNRLMPASERIPTGTVEIPNVAVKFSISEEGEPNVLITSESDGPGKAALVVNADGITKEQLTALLRVLAVTIEEHEEE